MKNGQYEYCVSLNREEDSEWKTTANSSPDFGAQDLIFEWVFLKATRSRRSRYVSAEGVERFGEILNPLAGQSAMVVRVFECV